MNEAAQLTACSSHDPVKVAAVVRRVLFNPRYDVQLKPCCADAVAKLLRDALQRIGR